MIPAGHISLLVALVFAAAARAQVTTGRIRAWANSNKCLDVRGAVFANGTPVQIYDCNGSNAQDWTWNNIYQTYIRVAGTNFCLDAGVLQDLRDGTQLKIWECYNYLAQQQWGFVDGSIRLTGIRGSPLFNCIDLTDGRLENSNVIQTWRCTENNLNQHWSAYGIQGTVPSQPPPADSTQV
ncbi:carbohydrate-binding module family 13 protein [Coprinopsis sp. MPI-PUGE-AT-0042]|nr:carbohydrate-binding module family 13 protein [Coprinopsis sp. MPI-PUGE-AT-0042]